MSTPAPPTAIPWLGLLGVLMGAFISTLNGRLSSYGLADIRGAVSAGYDEGAWITTAQTAAQMLITLPAVWMGATFGPRRVLIAAALAFALISWLTPYSPNLSTLLTMQVFGGLASGCFIPLIVSFVVLNTPPKYWAFGIAVYALNLELSLNISASLEGWYVEHHSWRWIFWQNVPLALLMALCLWRGTRVTPITTRQMPDLFGFAAGGVGLALLYAALDQGNRLDWLNSGVIWGLLLAAAVLLAAFFMHEARTSNPLLNLQVLYRPPLPSLLLLVGFLRLTITATAFLIPLYLGVVRGFRDLEVGQTLIWIAAPQLIFCPLAALMLRRSDARLVASIGFIFVSVACLMVAYNLTPLWGSYQFLPSSLLQALGQSFGLSGIVFLVVLHANPQDALTFGAALQAARLLGGEIGTAFVTTMARVREQVASNLIGQHVQVGDARVIQRVRAYGAATTRVADPVAALARGERVLGNVVQAAATTQAVMDVFVIVAFLTALALLFLIFRPASPVGPASPPPLFPAREVKPP
ncbi:MAG TPA: MFS transporter [Steroidobacteraceae bacterium]|jgi:DHA2 family multidrug resistance protein|nr:MFS transporter [Steroidobacteraceae bacterium]